MLKVRSVAGNGLALRRQGDLGIVATRPDVVISPEAVARVVLRFHLGETCIVTAVSLGNASTVVIGERVDVDLRSGPRLHLLEEGACPRNVASVVVGVFPQAYD